MKDTLPDTLSALLRLAVQDCIRAEAQGVTLDMRNWYERAADGGSCSVCMAGAVLLYDVELEGGEVLPQSLRMLEDLRRGVDRDVSDKMMAIDEIRVVEVYSALQELGVDITDEQDAVCTALEARWWTAFCRNDDCIHETPGAVCTEQLCTCHNTCTGISTNSGRLSWDQYLEIAAELEGVGL